MVVEVMRPITRIGVSQPARGEFRVADIYTEFGMKLRVTGVVRGLTRRPMTDDSCCRLKRHANEGADICSLSIESSEANLLRRRARPISPYNGAYGLVGLSATSEAVFLKGVLRSVGRLFGAEDVSDTTAKPIGWAVDERRSAPSDSAGLD